MAGSGRHGSDGLVQVSIGRAGQGRQGSDGLVLASLGRARYGRLDTAVKAGLLDVGQGSDCRAVKVGQGMSPLGAHGSAGLT